MYIQIYISIYICVCIDLKLHTKYVCRSSLLMRLGLVAFPPLGLEASSLGWVPSKRRQKIAMFEKGHFSPLTQLANELQLGVLLIIRFNHLWNGHFWKASIIWNCDGTWSGWGGQKTNFQEALKIQPGAVRPRTLNICLEFCEVCCWRFGWAGNEAKINFGPGFQNLDKTNLEAPTTPLPWLSKWAPWRTWWWRTLELFWNRSNRVILIVS